MAAYRYALRVKTRRSLTQMEDWLDSHCRGSFSLSLIDMSEDLSRKLVEIRFQRQDDRDSFRNEWARTSAGKTHAA